MNNILSHVPSVLNHGQQQIFGIFRVFNRFKGHLHIFCMSMYKSCSKVCLLYLSLLVFTLFNGPFGDSAFEFWSHKVLIMKSFRDFHNTFSEMLGQLKLISMGRPRIAFRLRLRRAKSHFKQVFEELYVWQPQFLALLNSLPLNVLHVYFTFSKKSICLSYLCTLVLFLHVCLCSTCMSGACGGRRGPQVSWNWSFRWL